MSLSLSTPAAAPCSEGNSLPSPFSVAAALALSALSPGAFFRRFFPENPATASAAAPDLAKSGCAPKSGAGGGLADGSATRRRFRSSPAEGFGEDAPPIVASRGRCISSNAPSYRSMWPPISFMRSSSQRHCHSTSRRYRFHPASNAARLGSLASLAGSGSPACLSAASAAPPGPELAALEARSPEVPARGRGNGPGEGAPSSASAPSPSSSVSLKSLHPSTPLARTSAHADGSGRFFPLAAVVIFPRRAELRPPRGSPNRRRDSPRRARRSNERPRASARERSGECARRRDHASAGARSEGDDVARSAWRCAADRQGIPRLGVAERRRRRLTTTSPARTPKTAMR